MRFVLNEFKELLSEKLEVFKDLPRQKQISLILPYVVVFLFVTRVHELWRLANTDIGVFMDNIGYIARPIIHTHPIDLFWGLIISIPFVTYQKWNRKMHKKNEKFGIEYGSARWGTAQDIKPFIDQDPYFNIILSKTEKLSMAQRMPKFNLNRNKHALFIGGTGTGKTYGVVKPNLCQCHSSYVLTDPKGTLISETGNLFRKKGYHIYCIDTIDMKHSMHYNPFKYIREPKDILTLANVLYNNMKPANAGPPPDPFFDTAALLWLQAIIGLIWYEAPPEEQNINTLLMFLEADEVREDDEAFENGVDLLFKDLAKRNPRHFAVKQRKKYKKAAGKTAKSILISVGAYLSPFDIPEVAELVSSDDINLDTYGDPDQKSILYIVSSDIDTQYNFITAILFTQLFNVLCYKADKVYGGRLPTSVQLIADEFANIGQIPNFKVLIATIRSRAISIIMILQTKSQLKDTYKEGAETIIGNCDSEVFLGGKEGTTLKDMQENLGQETIDLFNESKTYSQTDSQGVNYSKIGRNLKSVNELNVMPMDKCIVQIRGIHPFYSDKYSLSDHPNYKYLADADEKNTFDFWKYYNYMKHKEKQKQEKNKLEHSKEGAKKSFDSNLKLKSDDRYIVV